MSRLPTNRLHKNTVPGKVDFSFRERALAEAARYGSDSWVFLRELLQNARDAGARRIDISVTDDGDVESITCRDDGCGMSGVHAHRYLFALYASSKEGDSRQAGQFGVGFWSVLRFKPDRVVIRSRPRGGDAWQVELNHRLENAVFTAWDMAEGTEIVLERHRPRSGGGAGGERQGLASGHRRPLADKVFDAAWRYGRFLTRHQDGRDPRRRPEAPIHLSVNGRAVHAEMALPAPSSAFRRRGFRGVVALGPEPRVELFANGLFVRRTSCLEDLLEGAPASDLETSSLDLPGSLAPQVVLDSSSLEPLLARSDVRQTRHLRLLVKTAEKELERLIERQLEAVRPFPWLLALRARLRGLGHRLFGSRKLRMAWWLAPTAVAGILAGWFLAGLTLETPLRASRRPPELIPLAWRDASAGTGSYVGNLGTTYLGPRVDPQIENPPRPSLTYEPAGLELWLAAFTVDSPDKLEPLSGRVPEVLGPYVGTSCSVSSAEDCVIIRLKAMAGDLRLPVPTGHLVVMSSVRRNGLPQPVLASAGGAPVVPALEHGDTLEYMTAPGEDPAERRPVPSSSVPPRLKAIATDLSALAPKKRVASAVEHVQRLVAYDRSDETVLRHREAAEVHGFAEAALELGRGDCDVQNGILVLLLRETGMVARLAVGYVGREGRVVAGLHAWAEVLGEDRRWHIADVSQGSQLVWTARAGTGPRLGPGEDELTGLPAGRGAPAVQATLGVLGAVILFYAALVIRRRNSYPASIRLAEPDIAALLGGAMQHPGLARLTALSHGRFIPLVGLEGPAAGRGRRHAISLHEARRRAAKGRLFSSAAGSRLAAATAGRGIPVIDAAAAEGRVAALGLGAVDLDEWSDLLDRSESSGLVDHLNEYLGSIGLDWRVALASPLSRPLKVIDLELLGLGRRQVLVDPRSADFAAAGARLGLKSDAAAFRLLDAVADHLDLARTDRAHLLATLARLAVVEKHGR